MRLDAQHSRVRRAWLGGVLLFLLHGLIVSTWVARIPAIQSHLKLNNAVLGVTLLCSALGAVSTIPWTGLLVTRFGSKRVSVLSTLLFCLALVLPALATGPVTLGFALFVFGAIAAAMDVSMNAQGVEVEKQLGIPTMSRFHGMFSLGAMLGAGIGGFVAAQSIRPLAHFGASALLYLVLTIITAPLLLEVRPDDHGVDHRLTLRQIPAVLIAVSAIGFCILLSEGAMADWTALYLKQVLRAGQGTAAAGYSVFSAAMAIFRFLGDWITMQLGVPRTVRAGSVLGACGLLWALASPTTTWAIPGFGLVGAGFSVIIPLVFGSGGRIENVSPGAGIATVTGIGYVGFIVGPPVIGFASQLSTLRYALCIVVACCVVSAILAGFLKRLPAPGTSSPAPEPH